MSTIYSDAAGNKYLGDCRWGNHDINYPTTDYLKSDCNPTNLSSGLNNLIDESGLIKGAVISQSTIDSWGSDAYSLAKFSPSTDSINNRFEFIKHFWYTNATGGSATWCQSFLDDGSTRAAQIRIGGLALGTNPLNISCVGTANNNSMSFLVTNSNGAKSNGNATFYFAGRLSDLNTNFNYYNTPFINDIVCFLVNNSGSVSTPIIAVHYILGDSKSLLQTGRAAYTISCSDGQTPGSQWATDMWVYDNNATLGYPVIGRVPNMLLGIGTYTYLKPVKIEGSAFPDNGSPWYLPVGTFGGKVLLMRCYSSMT